MNYEKDLSKSIAHTEITIGNGPRYLEVILWKSVDDMDMETSTLSIDTLGRCETPTYFVYSTDDRVIPTRVIKNRDKKNLVGCLSFVENKWDLKTIAHETLHFIFFYLEFCGIRKLEPKESKWFCFKFGEIITNIYSWLNEVNPHKNSLNKFDGNMKLKID